MKQEITSKINKMGKVGYVLSMICRIVAIMGIVMSLLAVVVILAFPKGALTLGVQQNVDVKVDMEALGETLTKEQVEKLEQEVTSENIDFTISGEEPERMSVDATETEITCSAVGKPQTLDIRNFFAVCIMAMLEVIMVLITSIFAGRLCKAFRDCESPFEENVVKKMTQLAYSLIPWIFISSSNANVGDLLSGKVQLTVDVGMIFAVIVVLILAHVFKYGAMLQQESDETL